jgi:hypothetical protein
VSQQLHKEQHAEQHNTLPGGVQEPDPSDRAEWSPPVAAARDIEHEAPSISRSEIRLLLAAANDGMISPSEIRLLLHAANHRMISISEIKLLLASATLMRAQQRAVPQGGGAADEPAAPLHTNSVSYANYSRALRARRAAMEVAGAPESQYEVTLAKPSYSRSTAHQSSGEHVPNANYANQSRALRARRAHASLHGNANHVAATTQPQPCETAAKANAPFEELIRALESQRMSATGGSLSVDARDEHSDGHERWPTTNREPPGNSDAGAAVAADAHAAHRHRSSSEHSTPILSEPPPPSAVGTVLGAVCAATEADAAQRTQPGQLLPEAGKQIDLFDVLDVDGNHFIDIAEFSAWHNSTLQQRQHGLQQREVPQPVSTQCLQNDDDQLTTHQYV